METTAEQSAVPVTHGVDVVPMTARHADRVLAIYDAALQTGDASFETVTPSWETWNAGRLPGHRFVAVDRRSADVLGWVAVRPVSGREVFSGVVEDSIYVDPAARGGGIGKLLLRALTDSTDAAGIWTVQAGIFPDNERSIALHRWAGFRPVGLRRRIGRTMDGRWRDLLLMERRSPVVD